jgi:hypothetical protein
VCTNPSRVGGRWVLLWAGGMAQVQRVSRGVVSPRESLHGHVLGRRRPAQLVSQQVVHPRRAARLKPHEHHTTHAEKESQHVGVAMRAGGTRKEGPRRA